MIEGDGLPIALRVAGLTFLSVGSFVLVLFLVTGITIHGGVFEGWCQMAFLAFCLGMLSHQGEARLVMVEGCFLP